MSNSELTGALLTEALVSDWAGHWRGSNATTETVICPLSFQARRPLSSVCNLGYTVAESKLNTYWATDLMHRLLHVPTVSEGIVDHYADNYTSVVELAQSKSEKSGIDSNALQFFAIDVWAYDIAAPGVGCTGKPPKAESSGKPTPASSSTPSATSSAATVSKSIPLFRIKCSQCATGVPYARGWSDSLHLEGPSWLVDAARSKICEVHASAGKKRS